MERQTIVTEPLAPRRDGGTVLPGSASERVGLSAIVALALGLRLFGLDKGIWQDEYSSLRLISADNFLATLRAHNHPPFYFLILRATGLLARDDSFLRLPSVAAGVGAVYLLWRWLRPRSRAGAFAATVLAATHPLWIRYSQEMRSYGLLLLLTTVSYWLADALRERWDDLRISAALAIVLSVSIATHLVAVFMAATVMIYLAFFLAQETRKDGEWRRPSLAIFPVFFVPPLAFYFFSEVFLTAVHGADAMWIARPDVEALRAAAREGLGWPALAATIGPTAAALLGILLLVFVVVPRLSLADAALLGAALIHMALLVAVSVVVVPVFMTRTALPALAPAVAFVGLRLARVRGAFARTLAFLGVALIAALFSGWWLGGEGRKPFGPWKELAESLAPAMRPGDTLAICPQYSQGPLLHYLRTIPSGSVLAFQADASEQRSAEVAAHLSRFPSGTCRRVWLLVREDPNVLRAHGALDTVEATLAERFGPPRGIRRYGLVRVVLHASAACETTARSEPEP